MGSKGSQQTATNGNTNTSGTSSTQLPSWLTDAAQQAVGTARTLSQDPNLFNPYPGQQVAPLSQAQQQGIQYGQTEDPYQMASNIGGATNNLYSTLSSYLPQSQSYLQQGIGGAQQSVGGGLQNAIGLEGTNLAQAGQAMQGGLGAAQGLLGNWAGIGPISAQQVAQNAQSMMSPYTQAVIDPTMALGKQALQQNLQQVGAQANQAGAFGGSRQGVQEGVAQSQAALGESNVLGQMLNTGYGQALNSATSLANTQQGLGEGAAQALAGYNANAGSNLAGMYGTAGNTLANAAYGGGNTMAGLLGGSGTTLAGYNQADITNALQTGSGLPQQYLQNLLGIGGMQQSQSQADINAQMGNYYATQQQPLQNLDTLLSTITGVPYGTTGTTSGTGGTTGTTTGTTTPSTGSQVASGVGTATAVAGTVALLI